MRELGLSGRELRQARAEAGLSQAELGRRLGVARSTIANVEAGRQGMSPAVRQLLEQQFPDWASRTQSGRSPSSTVSNNSGLAIDQLDIVYVFEESRSPGEIVQIRRVRAIRAGVGSYHLGLRRSDHQRFTTDTQVLWGGRLVEHPSDEEGWATHSIDFGRGLRRGETHDFAVRSWVERDAAPDTEIWLGVTMPTRRARIHLTFNGSHHPARAWTYTKPEAEVDLPARDPRPVPSDRGFPVTATFDQLVPDMIYGLAWAW